MNKTIYSRHSRAKRGQGAQNRGYFRFPISLAKKTSKALRVGLAAILLGSGPFSVFAQDIPKDYPRLVIGVGDLVNVTVVGYQQSSTRMAGPSAFSNNDNNIDLPTSYLVDTDGKILFPFIGEVKVAGLSQADASKRIMEKLAKYLKFPQVTILITESNSYNVSVLGEVARPGKYLIRGQPTFLSILSEAGGPSENSDLGGAMLIHKGDKTRVNLDHYLLDKNFKGVDPVVYPGDTIMVPKSGWPSTAEWAIIASIITSGVIVLTTLHH